MFCARPYFSKSFKAFFPCRKCEPCLNNRKRDWALRVIFEMSQYSDNSFITLTYDDDNLPLNASLVPDDLTKLWKRLRKLGLKFRYFACGEYGSESMRPHYHAIIFNVDCLILERLLKLCWNKGFVVSLPASLESALYVAGYVDKKRFNKFDFENVGLYPEFIRVSRRPGIGFNAIENLIKYAMVQSRYDVLDKVKIGGVDFHLPNYIKNKLREAVFDTEYIEKLKLARICDMSLQVKELVKKHFGILLNEVPLGMAIDSHEREYGSKLKSYSQRYKILNQRNKI